MRATSSSLANQTPDRTPRNSHHQQRPFLVAANSAPGIKRPSLPQTTAADVANPANTIKSTSNLAQVEDTSQTTTRPHRRLAIRQMPEIPRKIPPAAQPRGTDITARAMQPPTSNNPLQSNSDPDLVFPTLNASGELPIKEEQRQRQQQQRQQQQEDFCDDDEEEAANGEVAPARYDDEYIQKACSRDATPDLEADTGRAISPEDDDECVFMYSREVSPEIQVRRDSSPAVDEETDFLRNISPSWFRSQSPEEARTITQAAPLEPHHTGPLRETSANPRDRQERELSPSDSYDMLQSYGPLNPADKKRAALATSVGVLPENQRPAALFRPNAGLGRQITTSFVRGYGAENTQLASATARTIVPSATEQKQSVHEPRRRPPRFRRSSSSSLQQSASVVWSSGTDETIDESGIPDYFVDEKPWGNNSESLPSNNFFLSVISPIPLPVRSTEGFPVRKVPFPLNVPRSDHV